MFEGIEGMKAYRGKIEADYDRRQSAHKDTVIDRLNAEITQLRAELAAERELADRLADTGENVIIAIGMGWDLDGVIEAYQAALTSHTTRRNK